MEITSAFSHPQSKKCFTNASQISRWMIEAITPTKRNPKIAPITVPRVTIQTAAVNFAFFLFQQLLFPTAIKPGL